MPDNANESSSPELIEIYSPGDLFEAEAIRDALVTEEIPCQIEGIESTGGLFDGVESLSTMKLLVRAADAERAAAIIDEGDWPRYT